MGRFFIRFFSRGLGVLRFSPIPLMYYKGLFSLWTNRRRSEEGTNFICPSFINSHILTLLIAPQLKNVKMCWSVYLVLLLMGSTSIQANVHFESESDWENYVRHPLFLHTLKKHDLTSFAPFFLITFGILMMTSKTIYTKVIKQYF